MKNKKKISEYLWIATATYLILGFFNILFAWLGLLCFFIPLIIAIFSGSKAYCNNYCGRGQLLSLLGGKLKLSRNNKVPRWISSKWFRYGFLIFFLIMFASMLWSTYLVFSDVQTLKSVVKLFWSFKLPWNFANKTNVAPWIVQFSFGFYSLMLTSTLLGFITMLIYRPRTWCVYCPMGTMTQGICSIKAKKKIT